MAKNYGNFNYGILIKAFHINCTKFYQTFIKFFFRNIYNRKVKYSRTIVSIFVGTL